jgi:ATP-dependent Lhr-like helicase
VSLDRFHPAVRSWFLGRFGAPTAAQLAAWPAILEGRSTLLLAPTGSGKTLAAFLAAIERLMFEPPRSDPELRRGCRVLYVSPLKALAVDVERNLELPIRGILAAAEAAGQPARAPTVALRSGDTPARERARFLRTSTDILITTPESLYLLLTSAARENLRSVETVIVDEIHSLVATKRGAHLFLSLERLERLRAEAGARVPPTRPLQRIGLSATQRPLDEVARLLGGGELMGGAFVPRPVDIVDAGRRRAIEVSVEVPLEDVAAAQEERSVWPAIHPRLVELIRGHRSTMLFVNSRRLAERLAGAINALAGEELALAHHGSLAREQRQIVEERLKSGRLPAIVATSSLELGIDMGAVDLVIQIEAPQSVASGLQRIGRAGHSIGEVSRGVIMPKHKGDLLATAAATARMLEGAVEETFYPRNPLDVLAQQLVAIASSEPIAVDALFDLVRRAAPFAELPRSAFEGVLDMLSGRYPSDEFAELKPRLTWDRLRGTLRAREGARRIAIVNGGTIPDRGLYGVFLSEDTGTKSRRVGELDEEMVFESRVGEVFVLGASSWRIDEITQDQVRVSPAPGRPGKMPFWHGDRPGRPAELGRAIGELARRLSTLPESTALELLVGEHRLDERAARNLLAHLAAQVEATREVPSDRTIIVERFVDEFGDWRVCVLTPFGARVHAPWATAIRARLMERGRAEVELLWADDGMVFRLPESEQPPAVEEFLFAAEEIEGWVERSLGGTSLFAAHFRENAARALLLPRRHPGRRSPLWVQRKRSADLLAVASQHGDFPIVLETFRECLRDVFDLPALLMLFRDVAARRVRVHTVDSKRPSPFASSILFAYVANFIYDQDAPPAERRAQALALDPSLLRELLGEAELRELLDLEVIVELEAQLQRLSTPVGGRSADGVHDLLLSIGDLSAQEIGARAGLDAATAIEALVGEGRALPVEVAGQPRFIAAEDAWRYAGALDVAIPEPLPEAFARPPGEAADALGDLVSRYARTHGPFRVEVVAKRFGLKAAQVQSALHRLAERGRAVEGEFLPGGRGKEWCESDVLSTIRRRSLAKLRREVEPVEPAALCRFLVDWQATLRPRSGLEALLSVIEQLEGAPIPASALEREVLPARIKGYKPADLDTLCAAGEVLWRGIEPIGASDGRIALYLTERYPLLAPAEANAPGEPLGELASVVRELLEKRGALFFSELTRLTGAFPQDVVKALWSLVWAGIASNDTPAPLRALLTVPAESSRRRPERSAGFRSRLRSRIGAGPPGSEGRWTLLPRIRVDSPAVETERRTAQATALLQRYGVLTREAVHGEALPGGFSAIYPVLKAMEDAGRVRRGYFVAGLGALQFAAPGADDRLRALRDPPAEDRPALVLAATDPANPYGNAVPWPERADGARLSRAAGAQVVLHDGVLLAFAGKTERNLLTFLPEDPGPRAVAAARIAEALAALVDSGRRRALLIDEVDGGAPEHSVLGPFLRKVGFSPGSRGFLLRTARV